MKRFEGKLFGAALGFSFGGPIGALIGAALGHYFDSSHEKKAVHPSTKSEKELTFIISLILLLSGTARADGRVTVQEIEAIKHFFKYQLGYRGPEFWFIERLIHQSFQKEIVLPETCDSIIERTSYEERLFLLHLNYQVAVSDGWLSPPEEEFIKQASMNLGIHEYDYVSIRNTFNAYREASGGIRAPSHLARDPYTVLGLTPRCTHEEVQKAYRNLANKYHPDKVSHLGKEFIELANKRFTEIGQAYKQIKNERGIN
jgi:DnaJ like chaperone protein